MPAPFYLYGSSPSELAGQQQNYDRYFLGADESNRAAYQNAEARALQMATQARAEDDAARRFDQSANLNLWRYRMQDRERAENSRIGNRELALREQQYAPGEVQYSEALKLAPHLASDKILGLFPNLTPLQRNKLTAYSSEMDRKTAEQRSSDNLSNALKFAGALPDTNVEDLNAVFPMSDTGKKFVGQYASRVVLEDAQGQAAQLNKNLFGTQAKKRERLEQEARRKNNDPFYEFTPQEQARIAKMSELTPQELAAIKSSAQRLNPLVYYDPAFGDFRVKSSAAEAPAPAMPNRFQSVMGDVRSSDESGMRTFERFQPPTFVPLSELTSSRQWGNQGGGYFPPSRDFTRFSSTPSEVIRRAADGRNAVFDATTKKFLRYANAN